jgi:hypothetical protein
MIFVSSPPEVIYLNLDIRQDFESSPRDAIYLNLDIRQELFLTYFRWVLILIQC